MQAASRLIRLPEEKDGVEDNVGVKEPLDKEPLEVKVALTDWVFQDFSLISFDD